MSNFGVTLSQIMKRNGITQAALAHRSGVNDSVISRYRSGDKEWISLEHLLSLMTAVSKEPSDGPDLLKAHLQDEIPRGWENRVKIDIRGERALRELPPAYHVNLQPDVAEAFEVVRVWAGSSNQVGIIIKSLAALRKKGDVRFE